MITTRIIKIHWLHIEGGTDYLKDTGETLINKREELNSID